MKKEFNPIHLVIVAKQVRFRRDLDYLATIESVLSNPLSVIFLWQAAHLFVILKTT